MGKMLMALCFCGYESSHLIVGGGLSLDEPRVPARCARCRVVMDVVDEQHGARCRKCRKPVVRYWSVWWLPEFRSQSRGPDDPKDRVQLNLPDPGGLFECPRCQKKTMAFLWEAEWD